MDPTKNRGRGGWLLMCLKPMDDERHCDPPTRSSFHVDESVVGRRKKRIRRSFYAVAGAGFFKTILPKKLKGDDDDENPKQDFYRQSSSLSSRSKRFVKSMKKNFSYRACWVREEVDPPTDSSSDSSLLSSDSSRSTTSPSLSSSSSSSSSSLSSVNYSRPGSDMIGRSTPSNDLGNNMTAPYRQKSTRKDRARKSFSCCVQNNYTIEMSLFVLCLGALVFWGKAFAIVTCTSTWLFFARAHGAHRLPKVK